ncbi:fumarylacetoacetate hydrolase family protein [Pseudomonas sp. S9]|uniref:fumarylacetoacetate hydrolase family protein n=1 Tax=Pseudomonas sp. S9 TaxID=686578 RepID=UPI00025573D3|nr:fumarylacetoacetate hydrolase family protein [Pseudomonas sp. S9]
MNMVEQVAARLIEAWHTGQRQSHGGLVLESEAQAYAVQQCVADALGWFSQEPARAWKLGGSPDSFISAAGVPADAVHSSGWQAPSGYCNGFGIEGELIVRLRCDLDQHTDLEMAYRAIDAWLPGIELCDTRWLSAEHADPLLRLADQQSNRALIIGEPCSLEAPFDWPGQTAEVRINGVSQQVSTGSHPFAEPLNSLPWLARHAALQGNPLRAGDLVATGSWTGICWAPPSARVEVKFAGLGSVTFST